MIKLRIGLIAAYYLISQSGLTFARDISKSNDANRHGLLSQYVIDITLDEAVSLGLRRNNDIRSLKLQRIRERFELEVAKDIFNPKIKLSGTHEFSRGTDDRGRSTSMVPTVSLLSELGTKLELGWRKEYFDSRNSGDLNRDGLNLELVQPLLRGAGREITTSPLRLAKMNEHISQLNMRANIAQTIYEIIIAYRALVKSQNQLLLIDEGLKRAVRLLEINKSLIRAGRLADFEAVQIEADIAQQELAVEESRNDVETSRLRLLKLLAVDLSTPIRASEIINIQPIEIDVNAAIRLGETQQPQYLTSLIQVDQASINLLMAEDSTRWDLSLVAGVNQVRNQSKSINSSRSWDSYAGLRVDIPINDSSSRQNKVNAHTSLDQQLLNVEQARMDLTLQITGSVRAIKTLLRQLEISQRFIELTKRKLTIETDKLNAGRSSNFQIVSYEADLRSAKNSYLNAQISYLDARAELDLLLGSMLDAWDISIEHI